MAQIFISYSRKDGEFVHRLDEELKRRGREAWVDWEGIRALENWEETIYGAIEGADTFIFVLTPDSVASEICGREIKHAAANNKRMVPLVARDVKADTVHESLAKLNWIFCRDNDDFQKATDTLVGALDTDLEWVHAHTRLLTRAIEWENKGKSNSFVLRGEDLRSAEQWLAQARAQEERQPTPLQIEYIIASRKAAARRQWIIVGALTFGLVVAAVLAFLFWIKRNEAEQRRRVAEARQLETQARLALDSSGEGLQRSALFAVESLKSAWTVDGYIACTRAISLLPLRPSIRQPQPHKRQVLALAVSSDGRWVASEDAGSGVVIWDNSSQKAITLQTPQRDMSFAGLAFSPNGRWLASTSENVAMIWNSGKWEEPPQKLNHRGMVWSAAFSPGGDLLALASYGSNQVSIYRTADWSEVTSWGEVTGKDSDKLSMRAVVFSPNGQWLATARKSVDIWNVASSGKRNSIEGNQPWAIAFSPDGRSLAVGDSSNIQLIKLDEATGESLARHDGKVLDIAFDPAGHLLASVAQDHTVRLWNVESRHELLRLPQEAHAVAFSADGESVLTGNDDGNIGTWSLSRSVAAQIIPHTAAVQAVAFSPDGALLVTGSADGAVRIFKTGPGAWKEVSSKADNEDILTVSFSPDGRQLVVVASATVRVYSTKTWEELPSDIHQEDPVETISFSPDGRWLAIRTKRANQRTHLVRPSKTRIWDLAELRKEIAWMTHPDEDYRQIGGLQSDSRITASARGDAKLLAAVASWSRIRKAEEASTSADNRWLLSKFGGEIGVRDKQTEQLEIDAVKQQATILDAVFSPDGRWLVTANADQMVRVWPLWTDDLLAQAMPRLHRNLTYEEWRQAFENEPYSKTCPDLPIHPSLLEAGRTLAEKGDIKGAEAIFRRAVELEPSRKLNPKSEAQRLAEAAAAARKNAADSNSPAR